MRDKKTKEITEFNKNNVYCGISTKGYGRTHFAKRAFKKGETIFKGYGKIIDHQTKHISIQIGRNKHFKPSKWTGRYWNHSCDPSTFVRTRKDGFPDLIALYDIGIDEEITYSYYMTEYSWSKNAHENIVICKCGSKNCIGSISSFSKLTKRVQNMLRRKRMLSDYLILELT